MNPQRSRGFTIIELMIATVVFSIVLLVIMGAIIQFGNIYYKGVIQSRTQERARAITEDLAKHIQFGRTVTTSPSLVCAGNQVYTYALKVQRVDNARGLVRESGACTAYPDMAGTVPLAADATEMLGERMQLTRFDVSSVADGRYTISVRVVYGENADFIGDNPDNACKPITFGGQFCAVAELTTTVTKRLK